MEETPETTLEVMDKLSFEKSSGLALDSDAKEFSKSQVVKALRFTQEKLAGIIGGQHGECKVKIRGVGGSFAQGRPKLGLFPREISYDEARRWLESRIHTPDGDDRILPSDIDLSLIFARKDEKSKTTIGDEVILSRMVREVFASIFNETRVFISPHDRDPMKVKTIDEVIEQLQNPDAPEATQ